MTQFKDEIKKILRERKMTEDALAKEIDFSQPHLNMFLSGQRDGSIRLYRRLSEFTGVSLDTLKESA